nr:hypothetical protein [Tanacetum cinerariifolium]
QATNARYWKIPACCCDDDDDYDSAITPNEPIDSLTKDHLEIVLNSNDDISSSDDNSLHEENIEYVEASPYDSELVILEAAEIVIPKVEEIKDDNLREKLLNSSSTSLNYFLEETNTFHNSLLEFENFYFDLGEISSGSTTTHSDISLPDYEAFSFNNDHIKEISSGSPTTQTDISRSEYDSFIFDLTHEEFVDELAHIISLPEYDHFYFKDLPNPDELMYSLADEDAHVFWRDQESWRIRSWRLYPRAHVHVLETMDGRVIYMFVDVSYPLSKAILEHMLRHGLAVPKLLVGGDLTMAEQLVRFIKADLLNAQSAV